MALTTIDNNDIKDSAVTINDIKDYAVDIGNTITKLEKKIELFIENISNVEFSDIDKKMGDSTVSDILDSELVTLINQSQVLKSIYYRMLLRLDQLQNNNKNMFMGFSSRQND